MEGPGGDDHRDDRADSSSTSHEPNPGAADRADASDHPHDGTGGGPPVERSGEPDSDGGQTESNTGGHAGSGAADRRPTEAPSRVTIEDDGVLRWFLRSDDDPVVIVRDVLSSVAIVALIALVLFAVSGIWPPLVAVESGSMEPNMERGDLIFVVDEGRFVGDDPVEGTGIVPRADANDHDRFGESGDVIVFRPDGNEAQTPVIHRTHFWVEEGDNWVDEQADPQYLNGRTCADVRTCPADHDGFITKGDANRGYDQLRGVGTTTDVVKPEWVTGKAVFRIPYLGYVRLTFDSLLWVGGHDLGLASGAPTVDGFVAAAGLSVGGSGVAGGAAIAIGRRV